MCIKQHQREKALLPKHCALGCFSSLKIFLRPLDVEYFLDITFAKLNRDLFICHQDFLKCSASELKHEIRMDFALLQQTRDVWFLFGGYMELVEK